MTTYGTATYNGTSYTLYGRPGSTLRDELNRLANGGEYPAYTSYKDVDGASVDWANINFHAPVRAATVSGLGSSYAAGTTGADGGTGVGAILTASAVGVISVAGCDGVTLALGDRVLLRSQSQLDRRGVYTVTRLGTASVTWQMTRATDFDNGNRATEVYKGSFVKVTSGTVNANKTFRVDTAGNGINGLLRVGTDNITFTEVVGGVEPLPAGANLVGALNYKVDPLRPPNEYKELNAVASEIAGITDPAKYLEIVTALRTVAS
jgi:hypothetical protein